ncbi:19522_t:CDS:2, partial [Gigaspora margarita]
NLSNISEEILEEIPYNIAVQKKIIELIQNANKKLDETKKMITKKLKQLNEENMVVRYDSPGHPPYYL